MRHLGDQSDEDMARAWKVFDAQGKGEVDAATFRVSLRLMGEKVPEERLDALFMMADEDGSGANPNPSLKLNLNLA